MSLQGFKSHQSLSRRVPLNLPPPQPRNNSISFKNRQWWLLFKNNSRTKTFWGLVQLPLRSGQSRQSAQGSETTSWSWTETARKRGCSCSRPCTTTISWAGLWLHRPLIQIVCTMYRQIPTILRSRPSSNRLGALRRGTVRPKLSLVSIVSRPVSWGSLLNRTLIHLKIKFSSPIIKLISNIIQTWPRESNSGISK